MKSIVDYIWVLAALIILSLLIPPAAWAADEDLNQLFTSRGVKGVIIIEPRDGLSYTNDDLRAKERYLPASTFKIYHSLIALDEKAVQDEKEVIPWDGVDKGLKDWNQDQTLETAFRSSCIWFFQAIARRINNEAYLNHLQLLEYGNRLTGPEVTSFWLDGDLRISALEQIRLLKKLYADTLPYPVQDQQLVKKIMVTDQTPDYTLRAKTGWASRVEPQIGWYVGWVETPKGVWFFALNMDITQKDDARFRREITLEALKLKGIL